MFFVPNVSNTPFCSTEGGNAYVSLQLDGELGWWYSKMKNRQRLLAQPVTQWKLGRRSITDLSFLGTKQDSSHSAMFVNKAPLKTFYNHRACLKSEAINIRRQPTGVACTRDIHGASTFLLRQNDSVKKRRLYHGRNVMIVASI